MGKARLRFRREDWIELGLSLLTEHGPDGLTIERLTEAAVKTRGSFYHHFVDHQAFLSALGEHWLERDSAIIAQAEAALRTGERRSTLARTTADIDHALERALRRLAAGEA